MFEWRKAMRKRTKLTTFFIWTLLNTFLLVGTFLYSASFSPKNIKQQRTDCSLHKALPSILPAIETRQNYAVLTNYIAADRMYDRNQTITLTTQGTYGYLHFVEQLCQRWNAPVSVAVYTPGSDFDLSVDYILKMRRCKDPCIKSNVTWHFVYDISHSPAKIPLLLDESKMIDCDVALNGTFSYRKEHNLTYPINVARNAARLQARTHYVLAADIELLPSYDLVPRFLKLVNSQGSRQNNVYVLPVFEVSKGESLPGEKRTLVSMFAKRKAIFFHRNVCDPCHRFAKRSDWLKFLPSEDHLGVFEVTKRRRPWEPFYIGTNEDPLFDERFTWEGKGNKMPQAYEMCLRDYDFSILDNAFLVHAPGIKKFSASEERWRASYARKNTEILRKLRSELQKKYNNTHGC